MRRRHVGSMQGGTAADGGDDDDASNLQQPLLQQQHDQQEEDLQAQHVRQRSRQQLIVHPGPFDLAAFVHTIWLRVASALQACWETVRAALPWGHDAAALSLIQEERLSQLREAMSEAYSPSDASHCAALLQLWSAAYPGEPHPEPLKNPRWKDMGWQGEDPGTDIRGAGYFGVQNLLYLASTYPSLFNTLLHKREGERAEWEYPFAVAGLNLTFMLAELLGLQDHRVVAAKSASSSSSGPDNGAVLKSPAGHGFVRLLASEPQAFEEVYCAAFQVLDSTWLSMKASYMEFNQVLKATKAEVARALASRPASVQDLHHSLGLKPQHLLPADSDSD